MQMPGGLPGLWPKVLSPHVRAPSLIYLLHLQSKFRGIFQKLIHIYVYLFLFSHTLYHYTSMQLFYIIAAICNAPSVNILTTDCTNGMLAYKLSHVSLRTCIAKVIFNPIVLHIIFFQLHCYNESHEIAI